ncbi:MAG: FprA family A-type flavoprotein [Firmicutes bacterium]|nr:FprA family A-type flavoprotein [Bacillota bacterium]
MDRTKVLNVTDDVKWIGILDPDLVTFDVVMETEYGTTYNSYFIEADKKTIVETSKEKFKDEYLEKVKSVVDPEEIEYIVLDHTEPDHSGNLRHLLRIAPNATVVASKAAIAFLKNIVDIEFDYKIIKHGDTLDLGNKTLKFISAPFLHWPDSFYTYLEEDNILFTCDSFGCHFCDERMFDDKVDNFDDAFKYYFDVILKPFSNYMLEAIEKIKDLDIDIICPGHGPILRENWEKYVRLSEELARPNKKHEKHKVFIPYVSAYGNTAKMAEEIAEGVKEAGDIDVEVMDIEMTDASVLEEKIENHTAYMIGCPTINKNILMPIYKFFAILNPITNKGKMGAAFGSFGWSGEGVKMIEDNLKNHKIKVPLKGLKSTFVPYEESLAKCREFGKEFGEKLIKENKL